MNGFIYLFQIIFHHYINWFTIWMFFVRPSKHLIKLIPQKTIFPISFITLLKREKVLTLREDKLLKFFEINIFQYKADLFSTSKLSKLRKLRPYISPWPPARGSLRGTKAEQQFTFKMLVSKTRTRRELRFRKINFLTL